MVRKRNRRSRRRRRKRRRRRRKRRSEEGRPRRGRNRRGTEKKKEKKTKTKTKTTRRDMPVKMKREQGRRRGNEHQCKARGELSIMVLGSCQGVLGGGVRGTQNRWGGFLGASREGHGGLLVWFWCSVVFLGSVLGSPNVGIPLIIVMFYGCKAFLLFFVDFERGLVLTSNENKYVF